MKKFFVLFLFFSMLSSTSVLAQYEATGDGELLNGGHQFSEITRFSKLMNTKSKKKKSFIGEPFIYEKWSRGEVNFDNGGWIEFDNIKINILLDFLEIKIDGVEKVLDKNFFSEVKVTDPTTGEMMTFVDASNYTHDNEQLNGFVKRSIVGDFEILTLYTARMASSGRSSISETKTTSRLTKKTKIYVSKNGKVFRVKKRKDLYKVFNKNSKKVKSFIKSNSINHKKDGDIVKLALFYTQ